MSYDESFVHVDPTTEPLQPKYAQKQMDTILRRLDAGSLKHYYANRDSAQYNKKSSSNRARESELSAGGKMSVWGRGASVFFVSWKQF